MKDTPLTFELQYLLFVTYSAVVLFLQLFYKNGINCCNSVLLEFTWPQNEIACFWTLADATTADSGMNQNNSILKL